MIRKFFFSWLDSFNMQHDQPHLTLVTVIFFVHWRTIIYSLAIFFSFSFYTRTSTKSLLQTYISPNSRDFVSFSLFVYPYILFCSLSKIIFRYSWSQLWILNFKYVEVMYTYHTWLMHKHTFFYTKNILRIFPGTYFSTITWHSLADTGLFFSNITPRCFFFSHLGGS